MTVEEKPGKTNKKESGAHRTQLSKKSSELVTGRERKGKDRHSGWGKGEMLPQESRVGMPYYLRCLLSTAI